MMNASFGELPHQCTESLLTILSPEPPNGDQLAEHEIDYDCGIVAHGCANPYEVQEILSVSGWVNDQSHSVVGTIDGFRWSFASVKRALSEQSNHFYVQMTYVDLATGLEQTSTQSREFWGKGGGPDCGGQLLASTRSAGGSVPLAQAMPRYYRLHMDPSSLAPQPQGGGLLYGGLLQRASVFLAYDQGSSTAAVAVWRDIDLPESAGKWTLRVSSNGRYLTAELCLQQLSATEVLPPLLFRGERFQFRAWNVLHADHRTTLGLPTAQLGSQPLRVTIEPA